jgi:mono/diheme cytochrome c family protein
MKLSNQLGWSMVAAMSFLACSQTLAQEPGQPEQGLRLAQQVCVVCHAIDKATTTSPNPEAPRFETIANLPGISAMALTVALRTSHRTMPNLILESDDVRNIAAYILSLK